ncbi:carboxypeptidase A6 isoform X2 [Arachis ipaensis]|uniref:carboxypeptidase A6 isoform X2 n=1 Tax=Arachis ipaensis TaxID=130454 RepID=UPI000A2B8DB1|nr:carboxypeptidase A6 isoform X2 [Arachis ipaensis]XP_029150200.1 carboxypeptidase A6 isoform X2 [Arachis hypogaea]
MGLGDVVVPLALSISICFLSCSRDLIFVDAKEQNLTVTPINYDLYHSSGKFLEEIKALVHRHSDMLAMETIKAGNKGYGAEITVVTYSERKRETDERSKFRILLSFGQHGRELITTELALRILSILSGEQSLPNMDQASLNTTLDKLVIKVIPMENLNGRKLVEAGDLCERRNGRGVDLNRNWSVDWGKKEKDYDPYEENPGTAPFSEPEAQIMRKLAISFEPHVWINVHSGMEALFMPYDHKNTTLDGLLLKRMNSLLEEVNNLHFQKRCVVGSGGGSVGYFAHGTATDFMYDVVRVPMSFTFERVLDEWSTTFFTIFKLGPLRLGDINSKAPAKLDKFVSIDEYLDGYLMERRNRYGKKMEVLDLGMQEIRTYFRLFLLSSVLLMFMFCSRISKSKSSRPVPAMPL